MAAKTAKRHQIVTVSGAKQTKTEQIQKTEISLSYGWQRNLVEFSTR
jgi:hypothetical protein